MNRFIKTLVAVAVSGMLAVAAGAEAAPPVIPLATGSGVGALPAPRAPFFDITAYGAVAGGPAVANQTAINNAIAAAAAAGGGTVVIPPGEFKTYTIRLKSNVGLHLAAKDSVLRAAIARHRRRTRKAASTTRPRSNLFVGLQDHGHSHWANSLIYGVDVDNVMISGPGLIDGGRLNARDETDQRALGQRPRRGVGAHGVGYRGGRQQGDRAEELDATSSFRDFST